VAAVDDLNLVFTDGEHLTRVVVPDAMRSFRIHEELALTAETEIASGLELTEGDRLFDASVAFFDELGVERWRRDLGGLRTFVAGPGEAPLAGRVVVSGRTTRDAPTCRDFAGCRTDRRFSLSASARY
jgi:hypothetical protein